MVCRFLDRRVAPILASLFAVLSACATLEEVVPGCGNHVVEDNEDCDGASGKTLCGEQDTPHQCRFIWDDTHDCPAGYVASPDKRCRKGSGNLIFSATVEISGRDPQIADFGGDGTVELGMTELDAPVLALYTVNAAVAERFAALPSFGVVALGEVSDDSATDIVLGTPPASNNVCADGPVQGTEPAGGSKTEAGLSVLRSTSDAFSLKVYANSTLGEAVRFAAVPFWLFGDCEVFDLEVLTRLAIVGDSLEICAVDDCDDTKTTIANVDPTTKLAIDANDAYAVVSSQGQGSLLYIPREGFTGLDDAFANPDVLTTPSGVTVEAGVALVDLDSDGLDDLVVLGREPADNFALYVLPGQAPDVGDDYPSLAGTVLQRWLEIPGWIPGDGGANVFETADFNDDSVPDFFLGDRLLISTGVVAVEPFDSLDTYYRTECVLGQDFSNVGPSCKGYAPGAVGDVDGDGLDDLVSVGLDDLGSETIQLLLGGDSLPLVRVSLQSDALGSGFLSTVAVSDFDGDGAADILGSFQPTKDNEPIIPSDPCDASQSLVLAYGKVGSFPEAPTAIAQVPAVRQITGGKFRQPPDGFGDFAVAVTCGSSATLFGDPYRRISSPFLFDDEDSSSFVPSSLWLRDVVTSADDRRDEDDKPIPHPDLLVAGTTQVDDVSINEPRVLLLPSWGDAELSLADKQELSLPARWGEFGDYAPLALGAEAEHGVVALGGIVAAYGADDDGTTATIEGDWSISLVPEMGEMTSVALPFPEPLVIALALEEDLLPGGAFARAATTDLNDDGVPDFALVYGSTVFFYDEVAMSEDVAYRSDRVAGAVVLALSDGDGYVAKSIAGFDLYGDVPVDLVVLDGKLLVVGQYYLHEIDIATGEASVVVVLGIDGFASEAAVADFSGDGLSDVMVFDGTRGYLLEQEPLKP